MEQQHHHHREQQQQQQQLFQELERESSFYKPSLQEEVPSQQNFDDSLREIQLTSVDHCDDIRGPADSQPAGAPEDAVVRDADVAVRGAGGGIVDVEVKVVETAKRKRGRPPRVQAKTATAMAHPLPRPQLRKHTDEEEDVCFICFDGGSLVLCDRKGCPKAYHPSCIKRDEAFFQSKAKWNCGWHICSSCQKASHYLCYTCTYSLCKGCTKDADFVCVRGNKGFCGICMRTIMLIENITIGGQEKVQVDFDDTSSWEYLFKVYWIYLKGKISLTLDELTQAKNPWKPPAVMVSRRESSGKLYDFNYNKRSSSENVGGYSEINHAKRRKTKHQLEFSNKVNSPSTEKSSVDKGKHLPEGEKWATNELLELVTHMKQGDTSVMSLFDVQALLLEYIKKNNLRDPSRKCEIICDVRLSNLFGKERVGHIEMLKLLEYHFLSQEKSLALPCITGVIDTVASQVETNLNSDNQPIVGDDKRRKTRKKADNKGAQANLDEYAAIDAHNINLIYLKRSSMESLISEADKFHDKVVGSMVRIKIPGSDQKQDMYRLVQVIGTSKAAEPYKIGERATDVMLEIANLNKKEVVSMDGISNQEFSEEECKRLRQCIKFGLIKSFTVGEIQEKAVTLQALRVNELLESEKLRLNHLRDRANENGHRKELRECVEKLQLLNSPDERKRRLVEIPEVHTDPNMDPNYNEDDAGEFDEKKRVKTLRPRNPSLGGNEREPISARKVGDASSDSAGRAQINSTTTLERSTNMSNTFYVDRDGTTRILEGVNESPQKQGKESFGLVNNSAVGRSESLSGVALGESPPSNSAGMAQSVTNFEAEKMWHYQDPTGKIQGPFALVQLRKWNEIGHFPPDLRVWMIDQKQGDSILLTDALNGQCPKGPLLHNSCSLPQDERAISDDGCKTSDGECSKSINTTHEDNKRVDDTTHGDNKRVDDTTHEDNKRVDTTHKDNKRVDGSSNSMQIDDSAKSESNDEAFKSNGLVPHCSNLTKPATVNSNEGQIENILPGGDSLEGNHSWSEQHPECNLLPSPAPSEKQCETVSHQVKENQGGETWKSDSLNEGSHKTAEGQINVGLGSDRQVDSEGNSGQSSGQNWRPPPPPLDSSSNNWDSNSSFVALAKSLGLSDENQDIDFSGLPSPTPPKPSHGDLKDQDAEVKQSVSSDAPMQDSGRSWSTASSPAGAGPQLPGEWGRYSPAPANPSVEEWDSDLLPSSSLRPTEMASDHAATPTSGNCQLAHTSPSHPASNAAWRAIIVVTEPDEFTPLAADESVSDLLAEVEAMESLHRLASSPTSALRCGVELTQGSENDCFSPVDGFSPTPDPGKSDAMSSSSDLQLHSHSTVTDEQLVVSQADVLEPPKSSVGHSSTSAKAEKDRKPRDDSVNQCEAGSNHQRPLPPVTSLNMAAPSTTWRVESETTNTNRGVVQGSGNFGLGGLARENADWGIGQWTGPEHTGMNSSSTSVGNPTLWGSQPRYGGDRYSGQRVYDSHGRENLSRDKGRPALNRQTFHSVGNGGGSYRPMPKGQRICKFYESGFCKKGSSCTYRHP